MLQVLNNVKFGDVRVLIDGEKELFCASDVAKSLGYRNSNDAIIRHCKGIVKHDIATSQGNQSINFITESDVFRLIVRSKLKEAEEFEKWLFEEVLPSIRKNGGYMVTKESDTEDDIIARGYSLIKDRLEKLQLKMEEDKPKVEFAEMVEESSDSITVGEFSKIIRDEKIDMGRNNLLKWLREKKYIMKDNMPYERYMDWFEVTEKVMKTAFGIKIFPVVMITGKGQIRLANILRKEFSKLD